LARGLFQRGATGSRQLAHVPAFAKVVAQLCADCQKECEKFPDVAECKTCGDSCKTCAEECRKVAA
jgi:hypothetical protein